MKNEKKSLLHAATEKLLHSQIAQENISSNLYLSMATWCDAMGYEGSKSFFYKQAEEERSHMLKFIHYLLEKQAPVHLPDSDAIKWHYSSLRRLFENVLKQEEKVTNSIHHIVDHALQYKDYATFNFLQWFVSEQREEENQIRNILDYFNVIPQEGIGLHTIDRHIGKLAKKETEIA